MNKKLCRLMCILEGESVYAYSVKRKRIWCLDYYDRLLW